MRARGAGLLVGVALAACGGGDRAPAPSAASSAPSATPIVAAAVTAAPDDASLPPGDVARGKALVERFECNRCHEGTGLASATQPRHCVRCHEDILAGRFSAPTATLARWQKNLVTLRAAPSLASLGAVAHRGFVERFLLEPRDLRPRLAASMPRFAITPAEARDVATYLARDAKPAPPVSLEGADPARGRAILDARGCGACHAFTGVAPLAGSPAEPAPGTSAEAAEIALAPDLRHARDRLGAAESVRWLLDPKAAKPDARMPSLGLSPAEARDVAAYLVTTPLAPEPKRERPPRLPVLDRRVGFDEVDARVFRKTCRHCHSEPDYALGDGGPGNSGGFGFAPRGLNLGHYAGVAAGSLDDHGERRSVLAPVAGGPSRLVASLVARQDEEAGAPRADVRGMPLGFPALTPEELQLVESWIAQGRPK